MKVYERTEDGVTTIVSVEAGVAEAERASTDRRGVPSMSSRGSRHHLEYRDGRIVDLVLVDAPAEEPSATETPAGRSYTVIYTDSQGPVVHATGCSHNVRDSFQGVHQTEAIVGDLKAVAAQVFSDFIDETGDDPEEYVVDLKVKPCAR